MKKILLSTLLLFLLIGCNQHHEKKAKVHRYITHARTQTNDGGMSDYILYWYLMNGQNNQYYYYSSPTPVTNYSAVTWQSSIGKPAQMGENQQFEILEDEEVPIASVAQSGVETEELTETEAESESVEAESQSGETESNAESSSDGAGSSDGNGGSE